jgi:hypothetical protein
MVVFYGIPGYIRGCQQVGKLSSLIKFIADAFLPAKIVKTTKTQISLPVSRTAAEEK